MVRWTLRLHSYLHKVEVEQYYLVGKLFDLNDNNICFSPPNFMIRDSIFNTMWRTITRALHQSIINSHFSVHRDYERYLYYLIDLWPNTIF